MPSARDNALKIIRFDRPDYVIGPDQGMPWPQAHIDAFNAAVRKWGRYPLTKA